MYSKGGDAPRASGEANSDRGRSVLRWIAKAVGKGQCCYDEQKDSKESTKHMTRCAWRERREDNGDMNEADGRDDVSEGGTRRARRVTWGLRNFG